MVFLFACKSKFGKDIGYPRYSFLALAVGLSRAKKEWDNRISSVSRKQAEEHKKKDVCFLRLSKAQAWTAPKWPTYIKPPRWTSFCKNKTLPVEAPATSENSTQKKAKSRDVFLPIPSLPRLALMLAFSLPSRQDHMHYDVDASGAPRK